MSIILNSIFPVFALMVLGGALKRFGLTNESFLKTSDRLIYYIFFPVMLFWKIGAPASSGGVDWTLSLAGLSTVFVIYLAGLAYVRGSGMPDSKVGSFSQSCYRFNTYVGMAVVLNALGDDGVKEFGVLIGVLIPFINFLAVSTLIWFSEKSYGARDKMRLVLKATFSNPLILACLAGIFYSELRIPFPVFLDNTFAMLSLAALPMALISVGGSLNFSKIRGHFNVAMAASLFKLLLLPLTGYLFLKGFGVGGLSFKVGMMFFTLPTSTGVYILSSQLGGDPDLASAAILLTTLLSFLSLSVSILLFGG